MSKLFLSGALLLMFSLFLLNLNFYRDVRVIDHNLSKNFWDRSGFIMILILSYLSNINVLFVVSSLEFPKILGKIC